MHEIVPVVSGALSVPLAIFLRLKDALQNVIVIILNLLQCTDKYISTDSFTIIGTNYLRPTPGCEDTLSLDSQPHLSTWLNSPAAR